MTRAPLLSVLVFVGASLAAAPAPSAGVVGEIDPSSVGSLFLGGRYTNTDPSGVTEAGPPAVAHRAGGVPAAYAGPIPSPRIFTTGGLPLEPSLGVRADGALFTVMLAAREHTPPGAPAVRSGLGPAVLMSTDGGVTWEIVHHAHPTTQDPYLHVDADTDRVFTVDFVGCMLISTSDDAASWTTSTTCGWNVDHQSLATGPPVTSKTIGHENVVYMCAIGGGVATGLGSLITCSKSADGGLTWAPTGEPAFQHAPASLPALAGAHCFAGSGHIFVAGDGTLLVPRGHCGQPWLAISQDEGASWTRVQVASNGIQEAPGIEGHDGEVVADAAGNLYYMWIAADWRPYYAVSRDGGVSWSAPIGLAPPGVVGAALPALAIGDGDNLAFAYLGTKDTRGAGAWWHGYLTITTNALDEDPLFLSTSVNDPADPLIVGECGPLRCQQAYDFLDVQVGPDGAPWMVLTDGCDLAGPYGCGGSAVRGRVATLVGGPGLR